MSFHDTMMSSVLLFLILFGGNCHCQESGMGSGDNETASSSMMIMSSLSSSIALSFTMSDIESSSPFSTIPVSSGTVISSSMPNATTISSMPSIMATSTSIISVTRSDTSFPRVTQTTKTRSTPASTPRMSIKPGFTSLMVTPTESPAGPSNTPTSNSDFISENLPIIAGVGAGVVIIVIIGFLILCCCCYCCCCRGDSNRTYNSYNPNKPFGVTARYWVQSNGATHYQAGDGDSISRASSFRSSIGGSIRRSFRRWSKRGGSKRASQRSGDVYANESTKHMYMTPL